MAEMKVHRSGGIVFVPTKEEREIRELRQTLKSEIDEVRSMKQEMIDQLKQMRGE